jgi:EmrB/QacA subfamily drug resistance transporter
MSVSTATAPAAQETSGAPPYRWRWWVLATVLAVEVMDLLDSTIVNVAAPTIRTDLGGSYTAIQWIAAGYTLAFAVMLVTGGRLGDIVGRRRMFVIGAAGFMLTSVACAFAQSPQMLVGSRVLQGAFGAVMVPQGFGIIKQVFPPTDLGKAFGAFGPVIGLSAVCGPIMAGALIDADFWGTGWRMIFFINVPLALAAIAGALIFMPESRTPGATRLDLPGMVLVSGALVLLIYPLVQGRELGWPWWSFAMLVAALPVLAVFVLYERRRPDSPLVQLSLFTRRAYPAGLLVVTGFFAGLTGLMLVFGLYVQLGLGYSPLHAGLTFAPWAFGMALGAALSGAVLGAKYGRRVIHVGLLVMVAGLLGLAATIREVAVPAHTWQMTPAMLVTGIGAGLCVAPLFDVILSGVRDHEVGSGSGVLNAVQQFAAAVGVALLGTIFFSLLGSHATAVGRQQIPALRSQLSAVAVAPDTLIPGYAQCLHDQFGSDDPDAVPASCAALRSSAPPQAGPVLAGNAAEAVRADFTDTIQRLLVVTAGVLAATFAFAFLLPRRARPEGA